MDSWDTANLVLGCFCIVLSFLPTGYLISNNRYKRKLYLYSLLICVANIGMALGSLPEYLMDAVVEAGERGVLLLGGTLYYGAFTCLLFFFLQYFFASNTFLNTCSCLAGRGSSVPWVRSP